MPAASSQHPPPVPDPDFHPAVLWNQRYREAVAGHPGSRDLHLARAGEILREVFPEFADRITLATPDEKMKRHGQTVAAASLPVVPSNS